MMIRSFDLAARFRPFPLVAGVLFASLLTGCGSGYAYEERREVGPGGWAYADSLSFRPEISDTLTLYSLWLKVEHTEAFPYQNLYVRIHTTFPDGRRLSEEVSLELADRAGQWYGDCGGGGCALEIALQENAFFEQAGRYTLTFEQFTRRDPVPGVEAFTLALERTGERPSGN